MAKIKKSDTEKLRDLLDYIESRVKCVKEMNYPYIMAFLDVVSVAKKVKKSRT